MKNIIVNKSIELLKRDGLKFTIDEVATSLKIAKKTIYKYFSTKEELALAIYEVIYLRLEDDLSKIKSIDNEDELCQVLRLYMDSLQFTKKELINRYLLKDTIYFFAKNKIDYIWQKIRLLILENQKIIFLEEIAFRLMIEATLNRISTDENKEELLKSFSKIIFRK